MSSLKKTQKTKQNKKLRLKLHSLDPKSSIPSTVSLHPGEWRERQADRDRASSTWFEDQSF